MRHAWDGFWFATGSRLNLGLFRIFFALCLLGEVPVTLAKSRFAVDGGFHLPYIDGLPLLSPSTYLWMHSMQYPLIVLLLVGIAVRPACIGLLGLQGYIFFADQLNFRNHPYFFLLVLLVFVFAPAGDAVSLRTLLRARRERQPVAIALLGGEGELTAQRMIQLQVCVVYVWAAVQKMHPGFLDGHALTYILGPEFFTGLSGVVGATWLSSSQLARLHDVLIAPETMAALARATVVLELLLPVGLWFRLSRPLAIVAGVVLHLGIGFVMDIQVFSYAMIASYLLFLEPEALSLPLKAWFLRAPRTPERVALEIPASTGAGSARVRAGR
ncbi:MAG: HTTM domain-containing protein [bacterium]|nr:HTTM domain-containing protein [bacterium]